MTEPTETYPASAPIPFQYELAVIGEECGEVVQMVGKIMRFGLESYSPEDADRRTNHQLLHDEVGDILAAVDFATERGLLDSETLMTRKFAKRRKMHAMAPNTVRPANPIYTAPASETKAVHPAIPITVLALILGMFIAVFFIGRETVANGDSALRQRAIDATQVCYEKYRDARCNDLAVLAGIPEAPPASNSSDNSN